MSTANPYAGLYDQVLNSNKEEKASILRPLKLDQLKADLSELKLPKSKERKERKHEKRNEREYSPYVLRTRNITKSKEEESSLKNCLMPLRRICPRLIKMESDLLEEKLLGNLTVVSPSKIHLRKPKGPLNMSEVVQDVGADDWEVHLKEVGSFIAHRRKLVKEEVGLKNAHWTSAIDSYKTNERLWGYPRKTTDNIDSFKEKASRLSLWCGSVMKVLRERVTSLAIHPSKERLIVAAGGRNGTLGLWVVCPALGRDGGLLVKHSADTSSATGVYTFEPHTATINCTSFCAFGGDKLITTSYDGTVRSMDLERLVFDELYTSPVDMFGNWMQWHCQLSPHVLLVSQGTGNVYVVDDRTHRMHEAVLNCYERSCRCVSSHPLHPMYLATATSIGWVSIWDLRKFGTKGHKKKFDDAMGLKGVINSSAAICHLGTNNRTVSSAFFSPVTGSGLLTTSSDNYIRLYDTSKLVEGMSSSIFRVESGIKHCNRTGKWLTPFRAMWHPQRDDAFVVGSLSQPRQVEIFGRHGRVLCAPGKDGPFPINTVCPVNAFHPNRFLLASADSGGRIHVLL